MQFGGRGPIQTLERLYGTSSHGMVFLSADPCRGSLCTPPYQPHKVASMSGNRGREAKDNVATREATPELGTRGDRARVPGSPIAAKSAQPGAKLRKLARFSDVVGPVETAKYIERERSAQRRIAARRRRLAMRGASSSV